MDMQLIRHRGTRTSAFGTLSIGEFECMTMESRRDMLDEGRHNISIDSGGITFGGYAVLDDAMVSGVGGAITVGLAASRGVLTETSEAALMLSQILRKLLGDGHEVELEVIDTIDYSHANKEVF